MTRWIPAFLIAMLLTAAAHAGNFKVLIARGDARDQEAALLEQFTKVGPHTFEFTTVLHEGGVFDPANLEGMDIVWFPWNGPGHDGNYFMGGAEEAFRNWVAEGHAVWISAFDDNYTDQNGKQIGGWFPIDEYPDVIVQNTGDAEVEITDEGKASGLFSEPNDIDTSALVLDDNWANLPDDFVVLAIRQDNNQPAAWYLEWNGGLYVEFCIDTRDAARAAAAEPLLENGLLFLGNWMETTLAVSPSGKAATTWGALKAAR